MALHLQTFSVYARRRVFNKVVPYAISPLAGPIKVQVRWSSATTEPHQPDAAGTLKGEPSSQKHIEFTSVSYVS